MKTNSLIAGNTDHWSIEQLEIELQKRPEYKEYLYSRGFLITTDKSVDLNKFPFFNSWREISYGKYRFLVHSKKNMYVYETDKKLYFLIGHAYNPFTMEWSETDILKRMSQGDFWKGTNELTGIYCCGYVDEDKIEFTSDAAGQQLIYYGLIKDNIYITSHASLVAGLCNLSQSQYIRKLSEYKYFRAFGLVLPGDLSPYDELKRAQCNFYTSCSYDGCKVQRFWPNVKVCETTDYEQTIQDLGNIIHNNMLLISKKWPNRRAAISVTGGMDSKTTMACTNGLYGDFSYFSYISLHDEKIDADAAKKLCNQLGLEHKTYEISDKTDSGFKLFNEILYYNMGCIGNCNTNDVRKRMYFAGQNDFDIEVKSWVDEIGRARYFKRFGKKSFPKKVTPRILSTLYKPFLYNRIRLMQTDKVFKDYLDKYYSKEMFEMIPWWDLVYWEFEWNSAEGAFLTGEHIVVYDITIPFNNRRIIELMLSVPLEKRIGDEIQRDIIHLMNKKIEETGIHVQDISHTDKRAKIERMYFEVNTRLPL